MYLFSVFNFYSYVYVNINRGTVKHFAKSEIFVSHAYT